MPDIADIIRQALTAFQEVRRLPVGTPPTKPGAVELRAILASAPGAILPEAEAYFARWRGRYTGRPATPSLAMVGRRKSLIPERRVDVKAVTRERRRGAADRRVAV